MRTLNNRFKFRLASLRYLPLSCRGFCAEDSHTYQCAVLSPVGKLWNMNNYESNRREDVAKRIILILARELRLKSEGISESDEFLTDLSADSLDLVELQQAIDEEFDTSLNNKEIDSVKTVGDLIEVMWKRVQDGRANCPQSFRTSK